MNSFSLLQDDVEDASDLRAAADVVKEDVAEVVEAPAAVVQDARSAGSAVRGKGRVRGRGKGFGREREVKDVRTEKKEEKKEKEEVVVEATEEKKEEDVVPRAPKEKEMSLEEYLAQKASLSEGLAVLGGGKARKANQGTDGFAKMSLLKKTDVESSASDISIMSSVSVKQVHENKGLKDSTQAAVANNAKIQSFFNEKPAGARRGAGNDARRAPNGDARRDPRDGRDGSRTYNGPRPERDFRRDLRPTPSQDPRGPRAYPPKGSSMAPNVDDTSAFPSL